MHELVKLWIERLSNLKEVKIDACFRLHNIGSLINCKKITKLTIHDCNRIEDLYKTIGQMSNLEEINLYNLETWVVNTMSDLSFLDGLTKLKYLKTDYKILEESTIYKDKVIKIWWPSK